MTAALEGAKVLVVEDEFLVASLIQEMLESVGCIVSGPFPRLAEALDAANREPHDAAVLDVNLGGDRIDPVAAALSRRKIPFAFVTGYAAGFLPGEYADRPRLCKPFKMAELVATLSELLRRPVPNGAH